MKIHILKTWPQYFSRVESGQKTFEVRKNDRDFQVGDYLLLKEYDPDIKDFLGKSITLEIGYILHGGSFGIEPGYCVIGLKSAN